MTTIRCLKINRGALQLYINNTEYTAWSKRFLLVNIFIGNIVYNWENMEIEYVI